MRVRHSERCVNVVVEQVEMQIPSGVDEKVEGGG